MKKLLLLKIEHHHGNGRLERASVFSRENVVADGDVLQLVQITTPYEAQSAFLE